ncbi:alpha/beta fold hydrolase [Caldimonas tepidiphila]|uniref:alpha/beta fold hydrolase n=1 Tax=Caldimonas tepidiphila TaxID=2315841 RepID=UPI001474C4AA|nr:alpha/beta hydrolase [Caldimonas tepidiphila]
MGILEKFGAAYAPRSLWTEVPALGIRMHARGWQEGHAAAATIPVVLVHGLSLSSRYMVPLGRRLAALGHIVFAPDLPGFGRTPPLPDPSQPAGPDVREQADQLLAWMDACRLGRVVLLGNSVGVQVVTDLAVRFPQRVDRLVLIGPAPDPRYRTPLRQYSGVLANMPFEPPSLTPIMHLDYASAGIPRMVQQLRRTVGDPIEQRLPQVEAPALVIRGQHDKTLSQEWAEEFTRLLPRAGLVVIDRVAHNAHYGAPQLVARLMHDFLLSPRASATEAGAGLLPGAVPDPQFDPLAPWRPLSTRSHGTLGYLGVAVALAAPHLVASGPRTRRLLTVAGLFALACSLFTDHEHGKVRKIPLPARHNIDAFTGMRMLAAAGRGLRGEPAAGRWAVVALAASKLLEAFATRVPTGPARRIDLARPRLPAEPIAALAPQEASAQRPRGEQRVSL